MLPWTEIVDKATQHFPAVQFLPEALSVRTDEPQWWIELSPVDLAGVQTVMLVAAVDEEDERAVRVMLPTEQLDWASLQESCRDAARIAESLKDTKESSIGA